MEDTLAQTAVSKLTLKCIKIIIVLALPSLLAAEKECIQGVTYLDPVTGNCDFCSDICDHARQQRTQARCEKLCQGYKGLAPDFPSCPPGQYYDQNVERCDHCDTICLYHPQDECSELCPDWTRHDAKRDPLTSAVQYTVTMDSSPVAAAQGMDNQGYEGSQSSVKLPVAIVLAGIGLLFTIGLAILAYVLRKPCAKKLKEIPRMRCNKRATMEVGEATHPMIYTLNPTGRGPVAQPEEDV